MSENLLLTAPPGWPAPPAAEAWRGMVGAIAESIAPHSETDPVAILAQALAAAGNVIGRGAWIEIEATRHYPNEFVVLVGESARARKGSSWDHVARVLSRADPTLAGRIRTGLSTGEGLIWAARDPDGGDPGCPDGRILVVEPEFVSVLKAASRDINTLSPVLRAAWDGRPLAILTRASPARATNAHITVIGHITAAELAHHMSAIDAANGFLNRFMFVACRRQRLLPYGATIDPLAGSGLAERLGADLARARRAGRVDLDPAAGVEWRYIYCRLAEEPEREMVASLLARAEAHVLRLSMLYALCDGCPTIRISHLRSALALWDYAAASIAWATTLALGDPLAERIHSALRTSPDGLTRTQVRDLFNRNHPAARIDAALEHLAQHGKANQRRHPTAGRPVEIWRATQPTADHGSRPSEPPADPTTPAELLGPSTGAAP